MNNVITVLNSAEEGRRVGGDRPNAVHSPTHSVPPPAASFTTSMISSASSRRPESGAMMRTWSCCSAEKEVCGVERSQRSNGRTSISRNGNSACAAQVGRDTWRLPRAAGCATCPSPSDWPPRCRPHGISVDRGCSAMPSGSRSARTSSRIMWTTRPERRNWRRAACTCCGTPSVRTWRCEARRPGPSRSWPATPTFARLSDTCTSAQRRWMRRFGCWSALGAGWPWQHGGNGGPAIREVVLAQAVSWGGRRVSNPRPPEPQSGVLPLNYAHHRQTCQCSTEIRRAASQTASRRPLCQRRRVQNRSPSPPPTWTTVMAWPGVRMLMAPTRPSRYQRPFGSRTPIVASKAGRLVSPVRSCPRTTP